MAGKNKMLAKVDIFIAKSLFLILNWKPSQSFPFIKRKRKRKFNLTSSSQIKAQEPTAHSDKLNLSPKNVLKEKTPIPCGDEELWNAWLTKENTELATYDTRSHIIKIIFMGNPIIYPASNITNFFKVSVLVKTVVISTNFYPKWEDVQLKFDELVSHYKTTVH